MQDKLNSLTNIIDLLRSRFTPEQIYDVMTWILAVHSFRKGELEDAINASGDTTENIILLMNQLMTENTYPKEVFDCPSINKLTSNELIELYRSLVKFNEEEHALEVLQTLWAQFDYSPNSILNELTSPCFHQLIQELSQEIESGSTVYDGAHGLGRSLLSLTPEVEIYGQDINSLMTKYFIRHCLIRGMQIFHSVVGNTLSEPGFVEKKQVKQFDYCISEIPFGLRFSNMSEFEDDNYQRYLGGKIPRSASDSLWLQHIIASLNDNGKAFVLIPEGVLFRGGYDAKVREELLRLDYIEVILKLPSGCMNSSSIPSIVIILNKAKTGAQKANVLIIDTSNEIKQVPYKNGRERQQIIKHLIEQVVTLYTDPKNISGLSKVVGFMDILKNNQQLSPSIYIKTEVNVALPDTKQAQEEYQLSKKKFMKDLDKFNKVFLS